MVHSCQTGLKNNMIWKKCGEKLYNGSNIRFSHQGKKIGNECRTSNN